MRIIYDEKSDTLLFLNPTSYPPYTQTEFKTTVKVDSDFNGTPIMMEVLEASIMFGMPKKKLKELLGERDHG